jgi:RNA polymerase sigma-70 factor, ECF subfamily
LSYLRELNVLPRSNSAEVELLYRQHGRVLLLFAQAITGDRGRAQDAVHQVFLKILEGASLQQVADVKAYLFASVRNALFTDTKLRQRSVTLDEESAWFDPPQRDYTAELNLRRALCALPEDQRQVVVLHAWGEFTFIQISGILDISADTAASRYRYALAKLRHALCPKENSCANS